MLPISIPKPCHQNWNAMTPNQKGRFCHACGKSVIDFTNMQAYEIEAYLKSQRKNSVCGRLYSTQLITQNSSKSIFKSKVWPLSLRYINKLIAAFLLVMTFGPAKAQTTRLPTKTDSSQNYKKLGKIACAPVKGKSKYWFKKTSRNQQRSPIKKYTSSRQIEITAGMIRTN